MRGFFNNFFRKDLNLNRRWWHRLFLVLFFSTFVLGLYIVGSDALSKYSNIQQWEITSSLNDRVTTEVRQISDLKKSGERVVERGRSYTINSSTDDSLYDDLYCSSDLENKISEVQRKSGIDNLYIRHIYNRDNVSKITLANYVKKNNVVCLIPDAFTYSDNSRVQFLEPLSSGTLLSKDLVFYERSLFSTVVYVAKILLSITALFVGVAIVYYKIFLYIIFGKPETE